MSASFILKSWKFSIVVFLELNINYLTISLYKPHYNYCYKYSIMTITKSVFAIVLTTVLATGAVLYFSSQSADLQCVARSTMISRGQDWVTKHVPYSQEKPKSNLEFQIIVNNLEIL